MWCGVTRTTAWFSVDDAVIIVVKPQFRLKLVPTRFLEIMCNHAVTSWFHLHNSCTCDHDNHKVVAKCDTFVKLYIVCILSHGEHARHGNKTMKCSHVGRCSVSISCIQYLSPNKKS